MDGKCSKEKNRMKVVRKLTEAFVRDRRLLRRDVVKARSQWLIQDLGKRGGGAVCQCKGRRAPKPRDNKLVALG